MIDFKKPFRFRGKHAAYAQYLCTERGQLREGGVNIIARVMDVYLASIIMGLKCDRRAAIDDSVIDAFEIFGCSENKGKKITSSDIPSETMSSNQVILNYLYRRVMLCD